MITRRKQNNTNSSWKPFATSTPLKIIPDKTKTVGLPQKELTEVRDAKAPLLKQASRTLNNGQSKQIPKQNQIAGQSAKKFKRNRSTFYLHMPSDSSDDDDSCLSSNGPVIKINSEGSTNTKLSLKNGDSKKKMFASPKNIINDTNKIIVENGVNDKTENSKPDEVISTPQKSNSEMQPSFRSKNNNYDYEKHKENSLKEKKIISQDDDNNSWVHSKKTKGEIPNLNGCASNSSTKLSFLDLAPTTGLGKSSQQQNVNIKSQNSIVLMKDVPRKHKRTKPKSNVDPEKKIGKKRVKNSEGLTSVDESPKNKKKYKLKIKDYKKNSSHQLFSDSMHQELINSLDLTTVELDNEEQDFDSPWKLTLKETLPKRAKLKGKAVRNVNFSQTENPKRSTRQRHQPREFWMLRNECDLHSQVAGISNEKSKKDEGLLQGNTNQNKLSHTVLESENEPTKKDFNQGDLKQNLSVKNNNEKSDVARTSYYPYSNEVQNGKGHVLKNTKELNAECTKATAEDVNTMSKTKKLGFTKKCPLKTSDAKKSEKDEKQDEVKDNEEIKTKTDKVNLKSLATNFPDVFKQLSQLPTFEDYVDGVQTAECWSLKNFKCGVLKVSSQCQISNKTSFDNSYFGGTLIKGSLKMKIGSNDLEINQGDMAFVPPLTEWCIVGTHESESLFYYWCGRFKT